MLSFLKLDARKVHLRHNPLLSFEVHIFQQCFGHFVVFELCCKNRSFLSACLCKLICNVNEIKLEKNRCARFQWVLVYSISGSRRNELLLG